MRKIFRYIQLSHVALLLMTGVVIYYGMQTLVFNSVGAESINALKTEEFYSPTTESIFNFTVAGIVNAQDSITVRAQTAGVITDLIAEEGEVVKLHDTLLVQDVPLLASRLELQKAQNVLTELSYDASRIAHDGGKEAAFIQSNSAATNTALTDEGARTEIENNTSILAAQLHGSIVTIIGALNFIDENQSYFNSKGLEEFRETVGALYGKSRTYLTGPMQYQLDSHEDILKLLNAATKDAIYPDTATLISLGELVDAELDATRGVFLEGESDFLDARVLDTSDPLYAAYLEQRSGLIEAQSSLRTHISAVRRVQMSGKLGVFSAETEETLRGAQLITATGLAENAETTQHQSGSVSEALLGVLYSEAALGAPRAPFAGIVRDVFVDEGEYVVPGTPLMTLAGEGAREIKVTVPYVLLPYLMVGASFSIDAHVVGHISRFAPMLTDGSISVFIELTDGTYTIGDVVRGEIQCNLGDDDVIALPRPYVSFNSDGTFVRTESGVDISVQIMHDTGKTLIVRPEKTIIEKLTKAVGIAL